jgi:hypothetical protein
MEREWSDLDCRNRTREKLFSHEFIETTLNLRLSVSANRSSYLSEDKGAHALSLNVRQNWNYLELYALRSTYDKREYGSTSLRQ